MDESSRRDDDRGSDIGGERARRHGVGVRVGVALLTLAMVVASVVAWQLVSARPTHPRSGAPPKTSARGGTGGGGSGGGAGGNPVTTTAPRTTTVPTVPTVPTPTTAAGPIRVLEIGDSLGVDLGEAMQSSWPETKVRLTMAARGDTGLANSGYYDWPTALASLLVRTHPQVVIVLLGANDLQSMLAGSTILYDGTPAWNAQYAARVTAIISESVRAGAHVLWIGEPVMQTAFINAGMTRLDGIARRAVARYPARAVYLDSNAVLAAGGTFSFDVTGPTGQDVQVRTPDGVHLMPAGAELLAAAAAKALATAWGMHVAGP